MPISSVSALILGSISTTLRSCLSSCSRTISIFPWSSGGQSSPKKMPRRCWAAKWPPCSGRAAWCPTWSRQSDVWWPLARRPEPSVDELVAGTARGDLRSAPRLIRIIDDGSPSAWDALKRRFPNTGSALVIGITGPPGAGKRTFTDCLIRHARVAGKTVGVLAVDPRAPYPVGRFWATASA